MANFIEYHTLSPFTKGFCYFDTADYLADELFNKNGVSPKFHEEYTLEGSEYVAIICRVKRSDAHKFINCMKELEKKMILLGHTDYDSFCSGLVENIANKAANESGDAE